MTLGDKAAVRSASHVKRHRHSIGKFAYDKIASESAVQLIVTQPLSHIVEHERRRIVGRPVAPSTAHLTYRAPVGDLRLVERVYLKHKRKVSFLVLLYQLRRKLHLLKRQKQCLRVKPGGVRKRRAGIRLARCRLLRIAHRHVEYDILPPRNKRGLAHFFDKNRRFTMPRLPFHDRGEIAMLLHHSLVIHDLHAKKVMVDSEQSHEPYHLAQSRGRQVIRATREKLHYSAVSASLRCVSPDVQRKPFCIRASL